LRLGKRKKKDMKITEKEGGVEFKTIPFSSINLDFSNVGFFLNFLTFVYRSKWVPMVLCRMSWYCDKTECVLSYPISFN
jgi:hypothetical protein